MVNLKVLQEGHAKQWDTCPTKPFPLDGKLIPPLQEWLKFAVPLWLCVIVCLCWAREWRSPKCIRDLQPQGDHVSLLPSICCLPLVFTWRYCCTGTLPISPAERIQGHRSCICIEADPRLNMFNQPGPYLHGICCVRATFYRSTVHVCLHTNAHALCISMDSLCLLDIPRKHQAALASSIQSTLRRACPVHE